MATWKHLSQGAVPSPTVTAAVAVAGLATPKARRPAAVRLPLGWARGAALAGILVALAWPSPRPAHAAAAIVPAAPDIAATSYILMDARTGHVIAEHNAADPLPPASLTKVMTAYVAIEEIIQGELRLDDLVHVSEKAWRMPGSRTFLEVNSQVSVADLLRGIIVQSGNDASVAIAEHISGDEETFAGLMNQYADYLGLRDSRFVNSSGLDTPSQANAMSARDLALLARLTIDRHGEYYPMYAEREFTHNGISQPNRNTLLFRNPEVDGLKTGWTDAAGFCLVASAERDGTRLISVVMGTVDEDARAIETQKLLSYGFRYYQTHRLFQAGQRLTAARVWSGAQREVDLGVADEALITIPRGRVELLEFEVDLPAVLTAPLTRGQPLGVTRVTLAGETLYTADLVAMADVAEAGIVRRMVDALTLMVRSLFGN